MCRDFAPVTYWGQRDYGVDGMIGLEDDVQQWVDEMVGVFRKVWRVLRDDGTLWVNLGDKYATNRGNTAEKPGSDNKSVNGFDPPVGVTVPDGLKPKDLLGLPWRVAFALQADGWYLRRDIIWHKSNPMPESATDRPSTAHEYVFLLTKKPRYFYDQDAVRGPVTGNAHARGNGVNPKAYKSPDGWDTGPGSHGSIHREGREKGKIKQNASFSGAVNELVTSANLRSVWTIPTQSFSAAVCSECGKYWDSKPPRICTVIFGPKSDALRYDMERKASPSCPVHAGHLGSISQRDEPTTDQTTRTEHIDAHHEQELQDAQHSTESQSLGQSSRETGSVHAAKGHSNASNKTDHVPATNPAYTVSAQIAESTDDKSESGVSCSQGHDNDVSNTSASDSSGDRKNQNPDGNVGIEERSGSCAEACTCSYICGGTVTSHYASFPEKLVEPCIKAGTSEKGECPECGAPWKRIVEATGGSIDEAWHSHQRDLEQGQRANNKSKDGSYRRVEIGWKPECDHGGDSVPQTILDPFSGAGTTGLVAARFGRRYIGIELNPEYAQMSRRRIADGVGVQSVETAESTGGSVQSRMPV